MVGGLFLLPIMMKRLAVCSNAVYYFFRLPARCSVSNNHVKKINNYRGCQVNKLIGIAIFCFASFLFLIGTAYSQEGTAVRLDWEAKYTSGYDEDAPVALKVLSAQINNGKLILDILLHNENKDRYMCVWFNTSESAVHIDDEIGNVYKGGKFTLVPMDNKFAPNQRKRLKVELQEPDKEVNLVNIHFGFTVRRVSSKPQERCGDSIIAGEELNFHKLDWDISALR